MNPIRVRRLRASFLLLLAALCAFVPARVDAQFARLADTGIRYAGNSTGTNGYSGDSGTANATSLNAPAYTVLDSAGNLFVSDTANNCVRKIDASGNISTVAGLRVSGNPDTCNAALNSAPSAAQGLLAPTGLALDSSGTLYIADSGHNCVRSLPAGTVDSAAANALTTVAGTCTSTDTASVTPVPNGLAVDATGNLYISVQDTAAATPVNQVLLHAAGGAATSVCVLAGQPSANVPNACSGITGTATLSSPAGLALDLAGNLFIADTGNNCVRELAGLTTLGTAAGQCANDGSSGPGALQSPYGLAVTPGNVLLISQAAALQNSVMSFAPGSGSFALVAGLASGAAGPYSAATDGQAATSTALTTPLGLTTDSTGNIYLADSGNNVVRKLTANLNFGSVALGSSSAAQTVTFQVSQASNLTAAIGADYSITANTCTGAQTAATTCQVGVIFTPTRPGTRASALHLSDSVSGGTVSVALTGTGLGPLSLFTPGIAGTLASGLRTPIAISVDSSGDAYVLEQGNATNNADILFYPAGSGSPTTLVAPGSNIATPTAMAVDAAGNIFVSEAVTNSITRFGADGSVKTSYVTGLSFVSALTVDAYDNLYIAQAGNVHNVIEVYAGGGRRIIAGSGSTSAADNVPATSAQFAKPSGLALGPNGLAIADATGQYVYLVDGSGTIHIVAGNGTSSATNPNLATGSPVLYPVGLAYDAAGDLYISDEAADKIFEVFPTLSNGTNITAPFGSGAVGYTGDGGSAPLATMFEPFTIALDGSSNLYVVDFGNNAVREVTYPVVRNINFGDVIIGNTPPVISQTITNAGNTTLSINTPITTSDSHYTVVANASACSGSLSAGGVCTASYSFTPTALGTVTATSIITSSSYTSPQTVNLTAYGLYTQNLPYTLSPETEVYGQPFVQSASLNVIYPDLPATGTMSYMIGAELTCSISSPFSAVVNCNAPESGLGVGTYTVNFSYTTGDLSYYSTSGTTTLTVTPGTLVITPANVTKLYGAPNPALTSTITGAVNGDVFLYSDSTTATQTSPVGSYPINATLTPVGLASLSNYNVTYNVGTLNIVKTALTVAVNNVSRLYGAANPTFGSVTTGAQNGDTFTITYSTTATPASPVGNYPITATVTGSSLSNYTLTVVAGTLTVTPAPLTVNVASATRTYGTTNPTFSATVTGAVNGDTFTQSLSTPATQFSPVGNYPINDVLGGAAVSNYAITVNPGTLTITKAVGTVTVTVNNATRVYGAANPGFTSVVAGQLNGDTFTITYTTTATAASPVGTYALTPVVSGANAADYNFNLVSGTLSITPAPLNVTPDNTSRPYNTTNPAFTNTITGLQNGDIVTVTDATTATLTSPAGTYPIVPTVSGAALSNYTLTTANGTLTITPSTISPLVVTVNSATRLYGAANPTFSGTTTGLLNGDTVTVTYSTTATASSPVGTYPITATVSGSAAANYTPSVVAGTLTVTPAPLTVAANNATRTYDAANPVFTGTTTGLVNGDTLGVSYTSAATTTSAPGTYAITAVVSGAAAANYTVNLVPGTLTVTTAGTSLNLATSASPVYYGASITLTASVNTAAGTPTGTVTFLSGTTVLGTVTLSAGGTATFSTSSLLPGSASITANYSGDTDFSASSASLSEVVTAGTFTLTATPATQFVRGAGTTVYTVTATSAQGFTGPIALSCSGLPSDATCAFGNATVTLSAGGTATTPMTVTSTANDAALSKPVAPGNTAARFAPVVVAATFPFELTGLGILFAGARRNRRKALRSPKLRLLLLLLCTAGMMGLAGCACFTSVYKNYTITITGTTTVPSVAAQSTSVILSVGAQ